jgi:hypothetical protein
MTITSTTGMTFASVLKGRLAERIIVTLLERGGFRVTRLGIEELFDEVKYLDRQQYLKLGLPPQLRSLPDLLIADPKVTWAKMLEIKFRRRFDIESIRLLHSTLAEQRRSWPDCWAVILIAEPFLQGGRFHQDYIRLLGPNDLERLTPTIWKPDDPQFAENVWNSLPMLNKLFHGAHANDEAGNRLAREFWTGADFITAAIKDLKSL